MNTLLTIYLIGVGFNSYITNTNIFKEQIEAKVGVSEHFNRAKHIYIFSSLFVYIPFFRKLIIKLS